MKTLDVLKEVLSGKRMSESSRKNYEAAFKSLGEFSEDFPQKAVEINKWTNSLNGYSDRTVRLWFSIVKSASEYMEVNYGIINPVKGAEVPRIAKKQRRYFKATEIVKILQACRNDFDYALIMTLVDSGCRIGGLSKLKGQDIGENYFTVKEKNGERRYRLDEKLCRALKDLTDDNEELAFGKSAKALSIRVIRLCRRAGLKGKKLGPHTIRHSSASLVARETKSAMAVKALLQQDNIQSSMVYIHDVEEEIQKGISPLQIVAEQVGEEVGYEQNQLGTWSARGNNVIEIDEDNEIDSMIGDMFPEVGDGVVIRPMLKTEDLLLIRKGFVEMACRNYFSGDVGKARELMKRMLRKVQ